ncbi:hypothetical protein [Streptomyces dysideae]|uniref:Uncharacterized protein n=1 Tax=Streptomyces dysideae TaxID=909626 RepID=A0A117S0D0_9ACTN|nr:hypothetical protein [Streptomyces dysideae]KUO18619.1 hypothetical protein AQJ91_24455 [Streptomyces dysideae]
MSVKVPVPFWSFPKGAGPVHFCRLMALVGASLSFACASNENVMSSPAERYGLAVRRAPLAVHTAPAPSRGVA